MAPKDMVKPTGEWGQGKLTWPHGQNDSLHISGSFLKPPATVPCLVPAAPRGSVPRFMPRAPMPSSRAAAQAAISQPRRASWELLLGLEGDFSPPLPLL